MKEERYCIARHGDLKGLLLCCTVIPSAKHSSSFETLMLSVFLSPSIPCPPTPLTSPLSHPSSLFTHLSLSLPSFSTPLPSFLLSFLPSLPPSLSPPHSEWSYAQVRGLEGKFICAFDKDSNRIVVSQSCLPGSLSVSLSDCLSLYLSVSLTVCLFLCLSD